MCPLKSYVPPTMVAVVVTLKDRGRGGHFKGPGLLPPHDEFLAYDIQTNCTLCYNRTLCEPLFLSLTAVSLFQVKDVRFSKCCVTRRTHHLTLHCCFIFLALIFTNTPRTISEIDLNPTFQHLSLNQLLRDACCILAGMLLLCHPQKTFPKQRSAIQ